MTHLHHRPAQIAPTTADQTFYSSPPCNSADDPKNTFHLDDLEISSHLATADETQTPGNLETP